MPNLVTDLVVDRVDLVDEGANSAAFIELYKRKEQGMEYSDILKKMKPEHAEVIKNNTEALEETINKQKTELDEANDALAASNEELAKAKEALDKANEELEVLKAKSDCDDDDDKAKPTGGAAGFDETEVLKAMPEEAKAAYIKMREQKEAAEEEVRKAAAEKQEQEAIAKAASLKALPVEQEKLVEVLKNCDGSVVDILTAAATAIDQAVLGEVGKRSASNEVASDAWDAIEKEAEKVAERDGVTKQKAVSIVIKEKPEMYQAYLEEGGIK